MKTWKKPELTVLVRSRPEEAVLNGCKLTADMGPSVQYANCQKDFGDPASKCYSQCAELAST